MKISEIDTKTLIDFCKTDDSGDTVKELIMFKESAISFVLNYTGLTSDKADEFEELTTAVLILTADFYDNREFTADKDKLNPAVKIALDMHCVNLL